MNMKTKLAPFLKATKTIDEYHRWEEGNLKVRIRRVYKNPPHDFMVVIKHPENYPDEIPKLKTFLTKFSTITEQFLDDAEDDIKKLCITTKLKEGSELCKALNTRDKYRNELQGRLHKLGFAGVRISIPTYSRNFYRFPDNTLEFSCHPLPDTLSEDDPRTKELINEIEQITGIHHKGSSYFMGSLNLNFSLKIDGTTSLLTRIYELEETL